MNAQIILEESTDKKRGVKACIGIQGANLCKFCGKKADSVDIRIKEKNRTIRGKHCSICEVFYLRYKDYLDNLDYFYQWNGSSPGLQTEEVRRQINKDCFKTSDQISLCNKCSKRLEPAIVSFKRRDSSDRLSRTMQCCPICGTFYSYEQVSKNLRARYDLSASLFCSWVDDNNKPSEISKVPGSDNTNSESNNKTAQKSRINSPTPLSNSQGTGKALEKIVGYKVYRKKCPICSRESKTANVKLLASKNAKLCQISLRYCIACDVFITNPSSLKHLKNEYDFSTAQFVSWLESKKSPENKSSALNNKTDSASYKPIGQATAITYYNEAPIAKIITPVQSSGPENYKEDVYCKVVLQSALTEREIQVSVSSTAKEHMKGPDLMVPYTSEMGRACAKAALKHLSEIYISSTKYLVGHTHICNASMVEAIVNKKAPATSYGSKQPVSSIDYSVKQPLIHVYYRLTNSCMRPSSSHDVESLTMKSTNARTGRACDINVYHCKTCGKYFVNNEALQSYNSRNIYPLVKFSLENDFTGAFRPNSILSIYGYNVKEGELTEPQRHRILAYIVDSSITTKAEAIRIIQGFVNLNGNKTGNQKARARWEDDIQFLSEYTKGNNGRINGKFIFQNK